MARISIIIPALNEEEFLPVLLDSLNKQSFRDFEIIVADAGSKDNTRELATEAGARVVEGGMPGVGRNRGAEVATGDFLFFFDADVVVPPDFLEKAYEEMQDRYLDLATCEFKPISDLRLDKVMFQFTNLTVKLNQTLNPRAAGFCIFITRRLFERIGGFDESLKLAEDHDLVERASRYRPLRVLNTCHIEVSVRRLDKEGRFSLLEKYFQVEWHLLTQGNVREEIVDYEFGNFNGEEPEKAKKLLDDLEERVIRFEQQYNQFAENYLPLNQEVLSSRFIEGQKQIKERWDSFVSSVRGFLSPNKDNT